jgi:hypothetical protein
VGRLESEEDEKFMIPPEGAYNLVKRAPMVDFPDPDVPTM